MSLQLQLSTSAGKSPLQQSRQDNIVAAVSNAKKNKKTIKHLAEHPDVIIKESLEDLVQLKTAADEPVELGLHHQEQQEDRYYDGQQGFVCFSWKSPFQRYIDTCHLVKIQVILEGYLVTNPNKLLKATSTSAAGEKFYSSEILCVRGVYGQRKLGQLFPNRSLVYPFILHPPGPGQNLIPSCTSQRLLNVSYRLKTRVVLQDFEQHRTRDQAFSSYTHHLPFTVLPNPSLSHGTLDFIQQLNHHPNQQRLLPPPLLESGSGGSSIGNAAAPCGFSATLSDPVARPSSSSLQHQLEAFIRLNPAVGNNQASSAPRRITAKLVQECCVEEGAEVVRKKVRLFDIQLDPFTAEAAIPFCLPQTEDLIPTLIEKDQRAKVAYHVRVSLHLGRRKKEESHVDLPLVVLVR